MAASLVSVVMQFLTPDMIAKIASALGFDRSVAQKAIGGAVPALLSSLADVAATPNGARQLTNVLGQQQGSLETLKGLIGGSGQNTLTETGSSMLSTVVCHRARSVSSCRRRASRSTSARLRSTA